MCAAQIKFSVIRPLAHRKAAHSLSVIVMKIDAMIVATIGATIVVMIAEMIGVTTVGMIGVITDAMIVVVASGSNAQKKKASAISMVVRSFVTERKGVL
jgi:predicted TIM-barrel enzyme